MSYGGLGGNCPSDLVGRYFDARGVDPKDEYCVVCGKYLGDDGIYCEDHELRLCEGCYEDHMDEEHGDDGGYGYYE